MNCSVSSPEVASGATACDGGEDVAFAGTVDGARAEETTELLELIVDAVVTVRRVVVLRW